MKKIISPFLPIVLLIGVLAGCGIDKKTSATAKSSSQKEVVLKVGAASTPHAEILKFIEPTLEKQGIKLDIVVINDGIQTNQQTANGELDANYFQHIPYLNQVNKDSGLDLVSVKGIHIEPFGVYSKKIKSIQDLSKGAKIAIPKDPVNFSRALQLFAANGLIELKQKQKDNFNFTLEDITKNDKHLQFIGVDGPVLVRSLDDVEAAAINTNYALEGGFKPKKDALIIEGDKSPYVNILAAKKSRKNDKNIQKLADALTTEKVKKFIEDKYQGAVVPAF
ncbi:MetQ/NlpA family ABC transporter substrate-binding protein [Bacillus salipaludis]|uniref:MetQ/NlpA family ABC transporter substrate-binding protein n=1 Tax=Bacillus salipaludis TaxID=2547811 RepID=UPI002E20B4FF|nr:MetQ/NlpA family ABC transporter substrate-binding protein [Bacillus salipaludis]